MFLYNLLKWVAVIAFAICCVTLAVYLWKAIKALFAKEKLSFGGWMQEIKTDVLAATKGFARPILIISLIGAVITNTAIHQLFGVHNLLLKPTGTYCFYVEACHFNGQSYTLPAEIRVEYETEDVGNDKQRTHKRYYINTIFFSNGELLEFSGNYSAEIGETDSYYERNTGDKWRLTLLNEHAYTPHVTETNNATWADIASAFVDIFPIAFLLFILCYKDRSDDTANSAISDSESK